MAASVNIEVGELGCAHLEGLRVANYKKRPINVKRILIGGFLVVVGGYMAVIGTSIFFDCLSFEGEAREATGPLKLVSALAAVAGAATFIQGIVGIRKP